MSLPSTLDLSKQPPAWPACPPLGIYIEVNSDVHSITMPVLLYYTKGRQVAGLGLVDIQPSVAGSRPSAGRPHCVKPFSGPLAFHS